MKEFRIFFVVFIAGLFCFTACQQVTEKYYVGCSYTVSFDANGGTGKMKSQTFEQGKPQNLLKNSFVAPSGKIFAGWVLDSEDKQVLYTDNQVINIEENCTLYAKWKMIEGSGSADETKEYEFVFDDWQTSDKNIKPGDDFYKFAAGRLFDGTGEGIKSILDEQSADVSEFYIEQAENPSFNLGKIAKQLKDNLDESAVETALNNEISEIDAIETLDDLYKKIAENLFLQNSAFIIYPEYTGRISAIDIGFGEEVEDSLENDSGSEDGTDTEEPDEEIGKAKKFYQAFKNAVSNKDWKKDESTAYKILNEFLKADIGMDLPELDFIKNLDEISTPGTESDLSLENAKEFLKVGAVQNSKIYNNILENIFKTQPFNYPVLKAYKEQNDPDGSARKVALEICDEFRETFKSRIKRNTWMSETSKKNAIKKADSMYFLAGYPEEFPEELIFEDFNPDSDNFIDFYKEISKKSVCGYIKRCFSSELPEDKKIADYFIFIDAPVTANAFYFPDVNAVNICAPNLAKPFFDAEYAAAYNYAVLGASTIGHEMCHAFDNTGSQYDEKGNKADWWTVSDKLRYKEKQKEMETLFNQYMMESGYTVNGEKTLGENMADYGGIVVAYEAFLNKKSQELTTEALTVQRKVFFQSYVLAWASLELENEFSLREDVHAPAEFRIKGPVSNMDDWYELYDVQYGDKYYLLPEQRIVLW